MTQQIIYFHRFFSDKTSSYTNITRQILSIIFVKEPGNFLIIFKLDTQIRVSPLFLMDYSIVASRPLLDQSRRPERSI